MPRRTSSLLARPTAPTLSMVPSCVPVVSTSLSTFRCPIWRAAPPFSRRRFARHLFRPTLTLSTWRAPPRASPVRISRRFANAHASLRCASQLRRRSRRSVVVRRTRRQDRWRWTRTRRTPSPSCAVIISVSRCALRVVPSLRRTLPSTRCSARRCSSLVVSVATPQAAPSSTSRTPSRPRRPLLLLPQSIPLLLLPTLPTWATTMISTLNRDCAEKDREKREREREMACVSEKM
mmetsp:Transcript_69024/g.213450  ORF Transcript_69024/g.213450 Transcript_69024/m.213450 type:complete len:235 (-) Transcript_69024:7-711(-)